MIEREALLSGTWMCPVHCQRLPLRMNTGSERNAPCVHEAVIPPKEGKGFLHPGWVVRHAAWPHPLAGQGAAGVKDPSIAIKGHAHLRRHGLMLRPPFSGGMAIAVSNQSSHCRGLAGLRWEVSCDDRALPLVPSFPLGVAGPSASATLVQQHRRGLVHRQCQWNLRYSGVVIISSSRGMRPALQFVVARAWSNGWRNSYSYEYGTGAGAIVRVYESSISTFPLNQTL